MIRKPAARRIEKHPGIQESRMRLQVFTDRPESAATDCLVIGITQGNLTRDARDLDNKSRGAIKRVIKNGDFKAKNGESLYLYGLDGIKCQRILLLGCGKNDKRDGKHWTKIIHAAFVALNKGHSRNALFCLRDIKVKGRKADWMLQEAAKTMVNSGYRRGEMKSARKLPDNPLTTARFFIHDKDTAMARKALARGKAIGEGMALARRLGDLPANVCTPTYLASEARKLARNSGAITAKVLNEAQMEKLGMGSLLSVTAGTTEPARLIVLEYKGSKPSDRPVALVGKGVTFDSGGISLKPGAAMDEMKYDMCGAASVLGTFSAIAAMKLPINVIGVIPATENMPSGIASKPGDIVTSMSGKTIEILNTDAEGRLILCDALTYVQKYKPDVIIDIATLTGAVIVALGRHASGLMGNNDALMDEILKASAAAQDAAWQLPLGEEYQRQLDSNFADMANIGTPGAGTITAACFLSRFTENTNWAHLDIAGTAWNTGGKEKGATGRPVPLLTQFLINRCS